MTHTHSSWASKSRSMLFVPGSQPQRFDKAYVTSADMVIIDLEDAVAITDKDIARNYIAGWLSADKRVAIRVNAIGTQWFEDDINLCVMEGVGAVVLPKAEQIEDIQRIRHIVGPDKAILPLVETAIGLSNAVFLAKEQGVQRLLFGSIDFQLDLGISGEKEELLHFRSQLVLASRLAGLTGPVDGVCTVLDDAVLLNQDVSYAKKLGFSGKLCIHPKQVDVVNDGFMPTLAEIVWARAVIEAMDAADGAAVAVDGKMVDKPVLLRAQRVLEHAEHKR